MTDISPTTRAKRKQFLVLGGALATVFAMSAIGVYLTEEEKPAVNPTRKADITTKSYIAPGEKIDPQDAWRGVSDSRLNTVEGKLSSLETENRELKRRLSDKAASTPKPTAPETMSDADLDKRLSEYARRVENSEEGYPAGSPSQPEQGRVTALAPGASVTKPNFTPAQRQVVSDPDVSATGYRTVRLSAPGGEMALDAAGTAEKNKGDGKSPSKTTQNYLPSGMFGQVLLLAGLDAPTGGQAQSNPHPVLLQLVDLAILPNRYRYDWDKCHITGAGYGDLSSERAYIRTETLSCVSKDGKVLDTPIRGYIVGEDGKAGIRGRLISKQGQVLGNALLAGVVSGIGTGLERASSIQSVSPLGSTTTTKPGSEFQSGIGAGTGKALDRLATYYIQLAEKMFPVVEVDAGRVVDVVLTQGVHVDVELSEE